MPKNKKTEIKKTEAIKVNKKETQPINKAPGKFTKKAKIILFSTLGVVAIAGASVGIYFATSPTTENKDNKVTLKLPSIVGLIFSNKEAKINEDYVTDLTLNYDAKDWILPDTLHFVKSNDNYLNSADYTYTVETNKRAAKLVIPAKFVVNTVALDLSLISTKPVVKKIKVNYNVELLDLSRAKTFAYAGEEFKTTLAIESIYKGKFALPDTLPDGAVKSGENIIASSIYTYSKTNDLLATLTIPADSVVDTITISFTLQPVVPPGPVDEQVNVIPSQFMGFSIGNEPCYKGKDYSTTLAINPLLSGNYYLPSTAQGMTVKVGTTTLQPGKQYQYSSFDTNRYTLLITGKYINDDVYIIPAFEADPTIEYSYAYHEAKNSVVGFAIEPYESRTIAIDWGDDTGIEQTKLSSGSATTITHEYKEAGATGSYDICVSGDILSFNVSAPTQSYVDYIVPGNQYFTSVKLYKPLFDTMTIPLSCSLAGPAYHDTTGDNFSHGINTSYSNIETVYVGENVTTIPKCAFAMCNKVTSLTIEEGVERILPYAFFNFKFENIALPTSLLEIGSCAFQYEDIDGTTLPKSSLTGSVDFSQSSSLKYINDRAFQGSLIETFTLPKSVESLRSNAFNSCLNLYRFNIYLDDSNLKQLGDGVFEGCKNLHTIHIPNSLNDNDAIVGSAVFDTHDEITVYLPFKASEVPAGWSGEWNHVSGTTTLTLDYQE